MRPTTHPTVVCVPGCVLLAGTFSCTAHRQSSRTSCDASTPCDSWLACFSTFGYASSFGVYQDLYTLAGMSSASNISWIGSVQLCLMFMLGLPSGKLLDEGYFHHICIGGSVLYVFSYVFSSCVQNKERLSHLTLAYLCSPWRIRVDITRSYFPKASAWVSVEDLSSSQLSPCKHTTGRSGARWPWVSLSQACLAVVIPRFHLNAWLGSSCGGIVFPIMINRLLSSSTGFAWGTRASAFLVMGLLAVANCLMSTRLPNAKTRANRPKLNLTEKLTDIPYMIAVAG